MAETKTGRVSIQTFGDCQLSVDGKLLTPPENFYRFLVYVLLEGQGRPVLRRRVGDLIWSDNGSEQAAADIRQALVRIRRFQDESGIRLIESDAQMLWLTLDNTTSFDLAEFLKLLANPGRGSWPRLCAIYKGELLASRRPAGDGFEEWLSHRRAVLRYDFLSAASRAIHPDSTIPSQDRRICASAILELDPYHEGAQRALMSSAAEDGHLSLVRKLYDDFARKLWEDLNVAPEGETVELYHRLMDRLRSP